MKRTGKTTALAAAVGGLLLALLLSTAASAAKPPVGRTYFVVSMGIATDASEAYEDDVGCVEFTRTEICSGDDCGTWSWIDSGEKGSKQDSMLFEFSLTDDETGELVEIAGRADIDNRGRKSAIGGAAVGFEPATGRTFNLALAGRAVGAAKCRRLAEQ